ncbi:hypothetical protein EV217_4225 [Phyllobacterium myrsinacearum]|nr:hypothetical protein EV217_4225 [Phyllobacterium myrsinacearum]
MACPDSEPPFYNTCAVYKTGLNHALKPVILPFYFARATSLF